MSRAQIPIDLKGDKNSVLPGDSLATPSRPSSPGTSIQVVISLPRPWFILSWWLMLLFHIALGSYAFSVTALHRYIQDPSVSDAIAGINVPSQTLVVTTSSFFVVGVVHFFAVGLMLAKSIKAKQLVLRSPEPPERSLTPPSSPQSVWYYYPTAVFDYLTATWKRFFGGTGYFGLSGPYFEVIFTAREAIEILLQTYQAYYLSRSVPRPWINQLAVISIVLNCLAPSFVHWLYKNDRGKRRLVNQLQDSVLDFCCSVVIPLSIVLPYVTVFDTKERQYPRELLMNDVWYVNAISELRQVLVTSPIDFVSTIAPHIGLFAWLSTLKTVTRRRPLATLALDSSSSPSTRLQPGPTHRLITSQRIKPVTPSKRPSHRVIPQVHGAFQIPEHVRRWCRFSVHLGFLAWGVFVVALHLDADYNTHRSVQGCQLSVKAWLPAGFPCSVMHLNCPMQGINGTADEITGVLTELERFSLRLLIFSHCSALEVPPIIAEFNDMNGLELFNCSLVSWPTSAAVRGETHASLTYVYLVWSNWTAFPDGLLHQELPESLAHLAIIGNDMEELPENIGEIWESHEWITVDIEKAPQLRQLPASFCSIQAAVIELTNTGITGLPPNCFSSMPVVFLVVSGSPVTTLPEFQALNFRGEHTAIAELPTWVEAWMGKGSRASLYGSPVCDSSQMQARTDLWEQLCSVDMRTAEGFYPWDVMLPQRPYMLPH